MTLGRKPKGKHPDKRLTAIFVRKVSAPGRYCDGNGLYLRVDPSGARRWEQRLVIRGRQRTLGLGGVSLVPLAEAREKALANRKIARAGGDPTEVLRKVEVPTFEAAAAAVIDLHRPTWRNAKHGAQWEATLRAYVYPRLGCQSALKFDPRLEWAPGVGQFQAATLTGLRGCSSSKRLGLRYPSAECRRRSL